jgi:DNA-binding response OmpR family regulator
MPKAVLRTWKVFSRPERDRSESPSPRRAEKRSPSATPTPHPVILIVDDNPDVRAAYRYMLEEDRFRVLEAPDADVALRLLKTEKVDLLLTDLFMDGSIDGVGLVHAVRTHVGRPAIIAMSGLPHVAYRSSLDAARALGADATLTKPFTRVDLLRTIRGLIGT